MKRDYSQETAKRVEWIKGILRAAKTDGIAYGNSGGKDSALVGYLCQKACANTVGIIMPCGVQSNYGADKDDGEALAKWAGVDVRVIDLSATRQEFLKAAGEDLAGDVLANIAPRLRMSALYAIAANENRLVAGTDNRSEIYMGYFTKWGDGGYDFNPIGDLTVTEVYEFLQFLGAPQFVIDKAPSAGLFEGQTDEAEMGISYSSIDTFLLEGTASQSDKAIIERYHNSSRHKRAMPVIYPANG